MNAFLWCVPAFQLLSASFVFELASLGSSAQPLMAEYNYLVTAEKPSVVTHAVAARSPAPLWSVAGNAAW